MFLLLETVGVKLNIVSTDGLVHSYSPREYLKLNMQQKVILNVVFPKLPSNQYEFRYVYFTCFEEVFAFRFFSKFLLSLENITVQFHTYLNEFFDRFSVLFL